MNLYLVQVIYSAVNNSKINQNIKRKIDRVLYVTLYYNMKEN